MKIKNFLRKNMLGIIGGIVILGTGLVIADGLDAIYVNYSTETSSQYGATKGNVQEVIDELYAKGQAKLASVTAPVIYSMPRLIYLNPVSPTTICKQSDLVASNVNNKTGCMKWYIYGETSDKYMAILDHNTTNNGFPCSSASTKLTTDTSSWSSSITKRLITADEIAKITGADVALNFNSSTSDYFYLDGSYGTDVTWQTRVARSNNISRYAWLFDYIDSCTSYGCNTANSNNYGYWTSTKRNASYSWYVLYSGILTADSPNISGRGVRPVIEINKSVLLNRG